MGIVDRMLSLDRRWIFLLVLLGVATPIVVPIGLPVTTTHPTRASFEFIDALHERDVVWISFDYGPSSVPENDPMVEAVMRQCAMKNLRFIVSAFYQNGGLGLANNAVAKIVAEFPRLRYGVDYVNLGYKDGVAAVMRRLGQNIAGAFPTDVNGTPLAQLPIMNDVHDLHQVSVVFTAATGVIGEIWVTQVHSQTGTPIIVGPTAVGAPKYFAFLNSGQMVGMVAGLKGAAEYEKLLGARYPEMAAFYKTTHDFTATKGMDAQTVLHTMILIFIILGNFAYFRQRAVVRKGRVTG